MQKLFMLKNMDLIFVIYTLIFLSFDYVVICAIEEDTAQSEKRANEQDKEESQLETKSGEGNKLSALDGTASEGDVNTYTNGGSQAELSEEYKSYEAIDEADSGNMTGLNKKLVIYQWPNGIVPYYVDEHSYDIVIYLRIRNALDAIQSASCLVFKPIPKPRSGSSFVHFTNPNKERECVHTLSAGRRGEPVVVLGYDCMQERNIIHSVMHLLGFRDEVTHPHRDFFIRIMWNNIQPKYRPLFTINTKLLWTQKLVEYDTLSVMHFHDRAFSINGGPTILPLLPDRIINPSDKLSLLDKMKLRIAFENECNRRQVHFLVETCMNYARNDKKTKDDTAEDRCAFDKFKVTTVRYIQSEKVKKERLTGTIGVQIGEIHNQGNMINNINGINNFYIINNTNESDTVGVKINAINNTGININNINGINNFNGINNINGIHEINGINEINNINDKNDINDNIDGAQIAKIHNNGSDINNTIENNSDKNNRDKETNNINGIDDNSIGAQIAQIHNNSSIVNKTVGNFTDDNNNRVMEITTTTRRRTKMRATPFDPIYYQPNRF